MKKSEWKTAEDQAECDHFWAMAHELACVGKKEKKMKIILENTSQVTTVNGVPARIWEGKTESGIPCFALITKIGVHREHDASEFERELKECVPPKIVQGAIPLRFFLD